MAIELSDPIFSKWIQVSSCRHWIRRWMSKFNAQLNEIIHSNRKIFRSISFSESKRIFYTKRIEWQGFNRTESRQKTIRFIVMDIEMTFLFVFDSNYYGGLIRNIMFVIGITKLCLWFHQMEQMEQIVQTRYGTFYHQFEQFSLTFSFSCNSTNKMCVCVWMWVCLWVCVESTADFNTVNFVTWKTWAVKFKHLINLTLLC